MKFFTVVDALKGYHQCALDEESMSLTTFATPEGLHQYTRLPMGINGRRFSDIFGHIPNMARCMEDLVVYSRSYKEHFALVRYLCKTANDNKRNNKTTTTNKRTIQEYGTSFKPDRDFSAPRDTIRQYRTRMFGSIVGHKAMPQILGRTIKF
jgi:hypothetical protein